MSSGNCGIRKCFLTLSPDFLREFLENVNAIPKITDKFIDFIAIFSEARRSRSLLIDSKHLSHLQLAHGGCWNTAPAADYGTDYLAGSFAVADVVESSAVEDGDDDLKAARIH